MSLSCKPQTYNREKAKEFNQKAIELNMKYGSNKDSLLKAIAFLDLAIENDKTFSIAYSNKLSFLMAVGNREEALVTVDKLIGFNKMIQDFKMVKGHILERMGKKEEAEKIYNDVLIDYDKLISKYPDSVNLKVSRVWVLFFTADKSIAIDEFNKIKKNSPDNKLVIDTEKDFENFNREEFIKDFCQ